MKALRKSHLEHNHGITFYDYQERISDRIIAAVLANMAITADADEDTVKLLTPQEITVEISRQAGKTSAIVLTVEFIMIFFPALFKRPISVGIFAPLQSQFKIDFDRLKAALRRTREDLVEQVKESRIAKEEENARSLVLENGARCLVYPIYPTSSPEGETLDLIIVEEAQDMTGERERIMTQGIFPMGAATNAPRVFIGTAGTQLCYFHTKINSDNALVLDCDLVIKDRRKVYEKTKNPQHLIYEQYVKEEEKRLGVEHDDFKRPFKLVWLLELGMFITQPQWDACRVGVPAYDQGSTALPHFFGLDTAKEADQTILKIGREIDGRLTCVFSMGMRGVNYDDQFHIILNRLKQFNIVMGAIDSTGQGDIMTDRFKRDAPFKVEAVKFSLMTKDVMYKILYEAIVKDKFRFFDDGSEHSKECDREMLSLVKEYKQLAGYLSVHHPDTKDAHDDHADALALMSYAHDRYNTGSGLTDYYKQSLQEVQPEVPRGELRREVWG